MIYFKYLHSYNNDKADRENYFLRLGQTWHVVLFAVKVLRHNPIDPFIFGGIRQVVFFVPSVFYSGIPDTKAKYFHNVKHKNNWNNLFHFLVQQFKSAFLEVVLGHIMDVFPLAYYRKLKWITEASDQNQLQRLNLLSLYGSTKWSLRDLG